MAAQRRRNPRFQPATVEGLDAIFRPRAVAVVGASRRRHQIGNEIVRNLVDGGFTGPVYPVNPAADVVHSMPAWQRVAAIPGPVDLAVVVVPAQHVLAAARDCARKGVRGLVVISAGFAEVGAEGRARQEALLRLCRRHGIRVVGPNCMGVLNTAPEVSMNATFAATTPPVGGAAMLSQSGALGEAILADARALGLGVSMFASIGNRADVSPADLMEYWEEDPNTRQILLYLEAFGDPERFMSVARRVSRKKPVLVVKAGRTASGARAAVSHTGSLAGSVAASDSLLAQCGLLRVDSMKELFIHAAAAQLGRYPKGPRVAIVSNAGGPAILATDACVAEGLQMPELTPSTRKRLRAALPEEASVNNPVDIIASGDAGRYDAALKAVLADRHVDMVLAIFVSPVMIDAAAVARVFADHARRSDKPLVACLLGKQQGDAAQEILRAAHVPNYRFPEEAAQALAGLWRLAQLRARPDTPPPKYRVRAAAARRIIRMARAGGRATLKGTAVAGLLEAYGIPMVPGRVVARVADALEAAADFGWPVVLKVEAESIIHKSDLGGVLVDIRGADELLAAWQELERRFRRRNPDMRILVQPMRNRGIELFFGAAPDPQFGRLMAFGLGGIHVEVYKDVVFRLHPLTQEDAREMVDGIRAQELLKGARGKPPVDREQLVDVLLRLSRMLSDCPEILELDLNPYLAGWEPRESCVLDARVRVVLPSNGAERPAGRPRRPGTRKKTR